MDRSTKPSFNFVNLKHPDDLKDEETQLRIRRLAMTEVGKARRRPKTKRERNEIVLEFRQPAERGGSKIERLGGGRLDPFSPYPIEVDDSARALLAHIFEPNSNHARQLRGSWYPVGLSSPASFNNMLANSQNSVFQKQNGYYPSQDDPVALRYHSKALQHASEMLKDPDKQNSDEVLGTIASFMCHYSLLGNTNNGIWDKHREALLRVINNRGGYDAVENDNLRVVLTWADICGCFGKDCPPALPMPREWEEVSRYPPNSPYPRRPISLTWKSQLPLHLDWVTIFDDVCHLISLDQAFNEEQMVLAITSGSWVEPTLYRLLSIRPLQNGSTREHVMEEVCRLGTLIFIAPFWRVLGQAPVHTAALTRNLLLILTSHMIEWNELKPLLIWVVYAAAIETRDLAERSQFVFMLGVLMSGLQLRAWDDLMAIVKSVLWVDRVYAGSDDLIRDEVLQCVDRNPFQALLTPDLQEQTPMDFDEFLRDVGGSGSGTINDNNE